MKKVVFMLFILGAFLVNANAKCYVKAQYPGSGPAPVAYCWDVAYIGSVDYNGWEYTANKSSTSYNHGGIIATVIEVFGYNDYTTVDINYKNMVLYKTENLINAYRILVGKRYYYRDMSNTLNSGTIYAKSFSTIKDRVYFK